MTTIKNQDIESGVQFIEDGNKIGQEISRETINSSQQMDLRYLQMENYMNTQKNLQSINYTGLLAMVCNLEIVEFDLMKEQNRGGNCYQKLKEVMESQSIEDVLKYNRKGQFLRSYGGYTRRSNNRVFLLISYYDQTEKSQEKIEEYRIKIVFLNDQGRILHILTNISQSRIWRINRILRKHFSNLDTIFVVSKGATIQQSRKLLAVLSRQNSKIIIVIIKGDGQSVTTAKQSGDKQQFKGSQYRQDGQLNTESLSSLSPNQSSRQISQNNKSQRSRRYSFDNRRDQLNLNYNIIYSTKVEQKQYVSTIDNGNMINYLISLSKIDQFITQRMLVAKLLTKEMIYLNQFVVNSYAWLFNVFAATKCHLLEWSQTADHFTQRKELIEKLVMIVAKSISTLCCDKQPINIINTTNTTNTTIQIQTNDTIQSLSLTQTQIITPQHHHQHYQHKHQLHEHTDDNDYCWPYLFLTSKKCIVCKDSKPKYGCKRCSLKYRRQIHLCVNGCFKLFHTQQLRFLSNSMKSNANANININININNNNNSKVNRIDRENMMDGVDVSNKKIIDHCQIDRPKTDIVAHQDNNPNNDNVHINIETNSKSNKVINNNKQYRHVNNNKHKISKSKKRRIVIIDDQQQKQINQHQQYMEHQHKQCDSNNIIAIGGIEEEQSITSTAFRTQQVSSQQLSFLPRPLSSSLSLTPSLPLFQTPSPPLTRRQKQKQIHKQFVKLSKAHKIPRYIYNNKYPTYKLLTQEQLQSSQQQYQCEIVNDGNLNDNQDIIINIDDDEIQQKQQQQEEQNKVVVSTMMEQQQQQQSQQLQLQLQQQQQQYEWSDQHQWQQQQQQENKQRMMEQIVAYVRKACRYDNNNSNNSQTITPNILNFYDLNQFSNNQDGSQCQDQQKYQQMQMQMQKQSQTMEDSCGVDDSLSLLYNYHHHQQQQQLQQQLQSSSQSLIDSP